MADAPKRRRKLGEVTAARIIADIVKQGWCTGDVLGNEQELMQRYAISRATFREAVRQLEWHGLACMRRGANGGLIVKARPRSAIIAAAKTYMTLTKVTETEKQAVSAILRRAPRADELERPNEAIALFLEALDGPPITQHPPSETRVLGLPKLSERIARQLVLDIHAAGLAPGDLLGSASYLQERYNVSRAVLREGLRPLELHDIVRVKTGAQGGIIVHSCDPEYTIELASAYLAHASIPLSHVWEAQSSLMFAAVDMAMQNPGEIDMQALRKACRELEKARAPNYFASAVNFHQTLARMSGNSAMALIIGILLRFGLSVLPEPNPDFLPKLKDDHARLIDAIADGDRAAASGIIRGMFDHSRRWILRVEAMMRYRTP